MRVTGPLAPNAVVFVNGGSGRDVPGTWSASVEYLVRRLGRRFSDLGLAEVKYRIKSWNRLEMCTEDALDAIEHAVAHGAERILLVGYSMGGLVAIRAAGHSAVERVLGLAPWIPDRLPLRTLRGKRLDVLHGELDRYLPGIPGVSPTGSRRGFDRAQREGIDGTYRLIRGAIHPIALRAPWGGVVAAPRARAWIRLVAVELERFEMATASTAEHLSRPSS